MVGELAVIEILDLLRSSMDARKMNSHTEEFNLSNIAMLMDVAMQFGIDIRKFNADMR
ncbi:MAG: hypothetical protein HMLIMOIP_002163 [Candidatus Nitrosomirales archaeon]|jgi:hypothetical protein